MVDHVNYWYNEQIRNIIKQISRVFSNFYISSGNDDEGNPILRRVPVTYMSTDKSVWATITKNTDTIISSAPRMVFTISGVSLNSNKQVGPAMEPYMSSFTEKKWDENIENYEHEIGNSYNITRLNPVPLGLTIKLYILTTMPSTKLQLFEQIRGLFFPMLEFQTSENPLDWSRIQSMILSNVNWSSKSDSNLDSSQLDVMDMTFNIDTTFDYPSLIQKQRLIETINTDIGYGNNIEDVLSWEFDDVLRSSFSPTNNNIQIFENNYIKLLPSNKCSTWHELFEIYGIDYKNRLSDITIKVYPYADFENSPIISGNITSITDNPSIITWNINADTLPSTNIEPIDNIINPHDFNPMGYPVGSRYLILNDIENNTEIWGTNFVDQDNNPIQSFQSQQIIQKIDDGWKLSLDPSKEDKELYVYDKSNIHYLYTYNKEHNIWVDYINKNSIPVGNWRVEIVEK